MGFLCLEGHGRRGAPMGMGRCCVRECEGCHQPKAAAQLKLCLQDPPTPPLLSYNLILHFSSIPS